MPAASDPEAEVADPVEPAEPDVSANAAGIASAAEPTPSATASAPTRPICAAGVAEAHAHAGSFIHTRGEPIT